VLAAGDQRQALGRAALFEQRVRLTPEHVGISREFEQRHRVVLN
jgi:hypothetical protein